ncbi:high affinity copper uptake protein 1 isoform X1 [Metopolophium dirhodum]|uniref:high affinity copper uptake protein 1 isoform X1 n=1 Tax=Metopolophium dirhodum TaxID=44670 RepID=UPI0029903404|nr:high affinity copper uptake protein 1 isoform X1 [Metopolophium dirhodum]XP_060872921.1 high affinity copper uptake protein 1 isoform X1 [Metopolophium dirhodum]
MSHDHHNHNHHAIENHEHTTESGDSCCPGSDAPASSGQHMMHHMMSMSFHFGTNETVLFDWWKFSTTSGLVYSMIGIFLMATLYEGLKYFREYLFWKSYNAIQYRSVQIPLEKGPNDPVSQMVGKVLLKQPLPTMFSITHLLQTFLHIIQISISYLLMLIFMTYNVWLCLAVLFGATLGYFLFGWKKSVVVDVTEHCH